MCRGTSHFSLVMSRIIRVLFQMLFDEFVAGSNDVILSLCQLSLQLLNIDGVQRFESLQSLGNGLKL